MIIVENLTKSYAGQMLFEKASFKVNSRERIGLVGRNGHGKTTFFRMVEGKETPDEGAIIVPKNYRINCVQQHISFTENTVLAEGMLDLPEDEKHCFWKVEKILAGLGFSERQMHMSPHNFSGGYQVRLNLAKALASEPDLLLLDEPTNYLDITSIRWIEGFLSQWPHELMLITHDRSLMDKLVTHVVGIHRKSIRKIAGNTEKYYTQIAQEEEIYEKTRLNDERKQKEIQLFINRFRAKARLANMVQSRIKTLAKLDNKEKLDTLKNLEFAFRYKPYKSKSVMTIEDLTFGYDAPPLIRNLSLSVKAGDRICIVGKNGTGKTTLLKLIAETLFPQKGQILYHPEVEKRFFEQTNIQSLVDERTVEEEILYACENIAQQSVRNICGAMMFQGDDALKKIRVLSGGEKSRVMLGKILVTPVNLLLLDEPSNHLDMESCDALLAAIDSFEGTVIMVTHNELFLHAVAQRLIVFKDDKTYVFEGTYQEFLQKEGWDDEDGRPTNYDSSATIDNMLSKPSKKELKKLRSSIITNRSKALRPLKERISEIENTIDDHDKNLNTFNEAMQAASQSQDGPKIEQLSLHIHETQTAIDTLFDELEHLTAQLELKESEFDNELRLLEE